MPFAADHDYHIHSQLSSCSSDPLQTTEAILQYAKDNGLSKIVLTDHFWDSTVPGASDWYAPQDYGHIAAALPLPQDPQVKFFFGCETDMDRFCTLGLAKENYDKFDFIIVPTTHLHMTGFTIAEEDMTIPGRARRYVERLDALLDMDLPFSKVGIAHLTCNLIAKGHWQDHLQVLDAIPDATFERLFKRVAKKGAGVELNMPIFAYAPEDLPRVLRPYRIAKQCGCKFYLGSDAHTPNDFQDAKKGFLRIIELLELEESDRFDF